MNGIDVSAWQPANITSLVNYDFVIIKATEGLNYVSPVCDTQYQAAKKRGKLLGVYHFATGLDPKAEADFFVNHTKGYHGEAVLVLDWEANAISRGAAWVRSFVQRVKETTGIPPIIYGSASPLSAYGIPAIAAAENCALWVAAYPSNSLTGYRNEPQLLGSVIRQYASTGRLNGYAGNLDLNRSTLTPEQWRAYAAGSKKPSAPITNTKPVKKSNATIASEVIAGKWGNGEERKHLLTAAGYNPTEIQALVNKQLGTTIKKTNEQIANEVLGGLWGTGADREKRLKAAGYNYTTIQTLVNKKVGQPAQSATEFITVPSGPAGYLGNIAKLHKTTVSQIVAWNKGKYPNISANYVQAGWIIRVK